jgi:hypothetical protein
MLLCVPDPVLGRGDELPDALGVAAMCGAHVLCGRGPYAGQPEL